MKFTKLALASAAAFGLAGAASATDLVADGLDTWADLTNVPKTGVNVNGGTGIAEAVWFGGDDADETVVKAYADEDSPAAYSGTHPGGLSAGANFLKVSNSSPLWRLINSYAQVNDEWPTEFPSGGAVNVADKDIQAGVPYNGGLFIDTLVQFTPSEDPPVAEDGSKLIVWMNSESNLCVTANAITLDGGNFVQTRTDFETATEIQVGTWYRLTVSAFNDVCYHGDGDGSGVTVHGFVVYVDGTPVVATTATVSADALLQSAFADWCYTEVIDLINAKKFFPSLDYTSVQATLSAVGFKGEGLVDDIVVTDVDPFPAGGPAGGIDFTLTWGEGVSAVWYAVGDAEKVAATKDQAIEVAADAVVTITADAADWYAIDASSIPATVADGQTYTITASAAATGGDAGVTGDLAGFSAAELQAAFPDSSPAEINAASGAYLDYQFGQDLGTLSAAPTVEITDIAENATTGWDITVKMFDGMDALEIENGGTAKTIKAALKVIQASTLAGLATAEPATYELIFDSDKTDITVNVTAGSFFKAYVEYAVPANN